MTDNYAQRQIENYEKANSQAAKDDALYRLGTHLEVIPCDGNSKLTDAQRDTVNALVSDTPIDFSSLKNYEIFSLNADGSFPMMRASCSKAVSLHDREVHPCGSGRCYRISLSAHIVIAEPKPSN